MAESKGAGVEMVALDISPEPEVDTERLVRRMTKKLKRLCRSLDHQRFALTLLVDIARDAERRTRYEEQSLYDQLVDIQLQQKDALYKITLAVREVMANDSFSAVQKADLLTEVVSSVSSELQSLSTGSTDGEEGGAIVEYLFLQDCGDAEEDATRDFDVKRNANAAITTLRKVYTGDFHAESLACAERVKEQDKAREQALRAGGQGDESGVVKGLDDLSKNVSGKAQDMVARHSVLGTLLSLLTLLPCRLAVGRWLRDWWGMPHTIVDDLTRTSPLWRCTQRLLSLLVLLCGLALLLCPIYTSVESALVLLAWDVAVANGASVESDRAHLTQYVLSDTVSSVAVATASTLFNPLAIYTQRFRSLVAQDTTSGVRIRPFLVTSLSLLISFWGMRLLLGGLLYGAPISHRQVLHFAQGSLLLHLVTACLVLSLLFKVIQFGDANGGGTGDSTGFNPCRCNYIRVPSLLKLVTKGSCCQVLYRDSLKGTELMMVALVQAEDALQKKMTVPGWRADEKQRKEVLHLNRRVSTLRDVIERRRREHKDRLLAIQGTRHQLITQRQHKEDYETKIKNPSLLQPWEDEGSTKAKLRRIQAKIMRFESQLARRVHVSGLLPHAREQLEHVMKQRKRLVTEGRGGQRALITEELYWLARIREHRLAEDSFIAFKNRKRLRKQDAKRRAHELRAKTDTNSAAIEDSEED